MMSTEDSEQEQAGTGTLGPDCQRIPFSIDAVIAQPIQIDRIQETLFVVESFDQLFDAVERVIERLE